MLCFVRTRDVLSLAQLFHIFVVTRVVRRSIFFLSSVRNCKLTCISYPTKEMRFYCNDIKHNGSISSDINRLVQCL